MPSLFLHRISVVRVYLHIAATTQDPAGQDLCHFIIFVPSLFFSFPTVITYYLYNIKI